MSVELIQKYYDKFNKGQFEEMLSLLSADVSHEVNEGEPQLGVDKFRAFMKIMDDHYTEQVTELAVFSSGASGRFAAEFYIEGVYKKSQEGLPAAKNQKYRLRVGAFFEVKNDKITRVTNYYNLNKWIALVKN
ncbi:MAG: nuclear transport factor 2 family protein [Bdellovibrionaceae bacterium]|nr:nuclear transport factor 2 family protein [Pseudobdellovibrionaceae bacterium]